MDDSFMRPKGESEKGQKWKCKKGRGVSRSQSFLTFARFHIFIRPEFSKSNDLQTMILFRQRMRPKELW